VTYELDEDTALDPVADGTYAGRLTDRWDIAGGMNGGYLAAFCLRGVLAESTLPDPLTMTVYYLTRPEPGEAVVHVTTLRTGRGHASLGFELEQGGERRCAGLAMCGRWRDRGPHDFQPAPPPLRRPEECLLVRPKGFPAGALFERLEKRVMSHDDYFALRTEPGEARTGGWTRCVDGRPVDAYAAALFLDSWPPAVFSRTLRPDPGGAPTLEYTVHWRNRPTTEWHYTDLETRTFAGGYVDEHGVLFDEAGVLVADSRQLARYTVRPPAEG